jgi:hypothetical protein
MLERTINSAKRGTRRVAQVFRARSGVQRRAAHTRRRSLKVVAVTVPSATASACATSAAAAAVAAGRGRLEAVAHGQRLDGRRPEQRTITARRVGKISKGKKGQIFKGQIFRFCVDIYRIYHILPVTSLLVRTQTISDVMQTSQIPVNFLRVMCVCPVL